MDTLVSDTFAPPPTVRAWKKSTDNWIGRTVLPASIAFENASRVSVAVLSLIWICAVGLVDYWTGYERSMMIFYLIPITLGTWFVGRSFGMFLSGLSVGISILSDVASGIPEVRYWNEFVGLSSYAIFVWLLARWRASLRQMDERVRLRTADLQEEILERMRLEKEMAEVTERERRRLGHDLHDSLCQHLTGTALTAQVLRAKLATKLSEDAAEAGKLVGLIEEGIDLTRSLARGLFSPDLEQGGLAVALEELAHSTQERAGINCEFHQNEESEMESCDATVLTQFYRIAQEAVTNAVKHARASRIVIELDTVDGEIQLNIFDDGIGLASSTQGDGLGLKMMRHGAGLIGATFSVSKRNPAGTIVSCVLAAADPRHGKP
ncbi:MAG TPA: sensor histidine kinase [Chthoniobacterales bacterium]|nr:sensor histidine kinase [Chthoniobacterales bacterium]